MVCGQVLPRPLPAVVRDGFDHFTNALEQGGVKSPPPAVDPAFEHFRLMVLHRVDRGQRVFGEAWRGRDMIPELYEELADAMIYVEGERAKNGDDSGFLARAQFHVYEAFRAAYLAHVEREKP